MRRLSSVLLCAALIATGLFGVAPATAALSRFSETVIVDAANPNGARTAAVLVRGEPYLLVARGQFQYIDGGVADVECTTYGPDKTYQPRRFAALEPTGDFADIYVNGRNVDWKPVDPDPFGCSRDHTYTHVFTPPVDMPLSFVEHELNAQGFFDNAGSVTITVTQLQVEVDRFDIAAASAAGVTSAATLAPGTAYRIQVSGTYAPSPLVPGLTADAECSQQNGAPGQSKALGTAVTPTDLHDDIGDVYVNGQQIEWTPVRGWPGGCNDTDHVYTHDLRVDAAAPVHLRIEDTWHGDNAGALHAVIYELADMPEPGVIGAGGGDGEGDLGPEPTPGVIEETFLVDVRNPDGATSASVLRAGTPYRIRASGRFQYIDRGVADAECTNYGPDQSYQRSRFAVLDPTGDFADIYVNGQDVDWVPEEPTPFGCSANFAYSIVFVPERNTAVHVVEHEINPQGFHDNNGAVEIRITEALELVGELELHGADPAGVHTPLLAAGDTYRIEVAGTYVPTTTIAGVTADAECVQQYGSPGASNVFGTALTPTDTSDDIGDVYVDGKAIDWAPANGSPSGCDDSTHAYLHHLSGAGAAVNLRVADSWHGDNSGVLAVRIYRLPAATAPPQGPAVPRVSLVEEVRVDAGNPAGASTILPLQAGRAYLVEASGVFTFDRGEADAECATADGDSTWLPHRFTDVVPPRDLLDLVIDGQTLDWVPANGSGECDTTGHTYRHLLTPTATNRVNFRVDATWHPGHGGSLTVKVFHVEEILVGQVTVNATAPNGAATPPLLDGYQYRLEVSGTWSPWVADPRYVADAECSSNPLSGGFQPNLYESLGAAEDLHDLYVGGRAVAWEPKSTPLLPCDENHTYVLSLRQVGTGRLPLRLVDTTYGDNAGALTVRVYLRSS